MAKEARNRGGTNICFDCKKACGGCSWSEFDPHTKQPAYKPVEGWKAIKVPYLIGSGSGIDSTYYISWCPEFEPDDGYEEIDTHNSACGVCGKPFTDGEPKQRKYCYSCVPLGYSRNPKTGAIFRNSWGLRKDRSAKHKEAKAND